MNYVYSTATCGTDYHIYEDTGNRDLAVVKKKISINGGHGVANKNFVTPQGVVTIVSDEDLELLEKDYHFRKHVEAGFITVQKRKTEPEKVAADMKDKDLSAPLTPKDFETVDNPAVEGYKTYRKKGKK